MAARSAQPEMDTQHCYSARLLKPFGRLLRTYPGLPPGVAESVDALDIDSRLPIATVHELLRGAILLTGDEDLGLRAAEQIEVGDYGALEYAASTAETAGEALNTIGRYMHLINDALTFSLQVGETHAVVALESAVVLPRAAEDFEVAAFFRAINARNALSPTFAFEVRFSQPAPADTRPYARVFTNLASFSFDQQAAGFAFPRAALLDRLPTADPKLHAVVRSHAERLLAELPRAQSLTARVRERLMEGLASGKTSADHVAAALHLSPRTLTRKLEQEGTNFKQLHEELRRKLALRYLGESDLAFSEIAFLLGFSQTAAFHRAFKRWTDQTPLEYRTSRRG